MVKYRRRYEIIANIISVAEKGAKKTRIMYFANLSHKLLKKYLEDTVKVGFVRESSKGYESTEKGRIFLEKYAEFSSRYSKLVTDFEALRFEMELLERMCDSTAEDNSRSNKVRRKLNDLVH